MSWSFPTFSGTLAEVRETVKKSQESWAGCDPSHGHSVRLAKAVINAEIDHIEAIGGTHVKVYASGHSDPNNRNHSISVVRDIEAESAAKSRQEAIDRSKWRDEGVSKGWLGTSSGTALSASPSAPDSSKASSS